MRFRALGLLTARKPLVVRVRAGSGWKALYKVVGTLVACRPAHGTESQIPSNARQYYMLSTNGTRSMRAHLKAGMGHPPIDLIGTGGYVALQKLCKFCEIHAILGTFS